MDRYVLIISVGPVQGFIAAARRSRDLWSGSWLLSEMSKAVAKYLSDQKAEMIFPYTEQPHKDLKAGSVFSVGNKIQVIVNAENSESVADLAKKASEEAKKCFQEVAEIAFDKLSHRHQLRSKIWDKQIDDYVETQAAWAKIGPNGYKKASEKAAQVLAARKATRDFTASASHAFENGLMIPKSSLDGARETVLPEENNMSYRLRSQLGLSDSEQLDCAGVAKRLGGDAEQFTPFTRVAAHAWIEALTANQKSIINEAYEPLIKLQLATRVTGNDGKYANLPFDAQLLYPSRLDAEILQADKKRKQDFEAEEAFQALNTFKQTLKNADVWKNGSQPCSYGVLLLADGDRMGELLDTAQNETQHKEITKALSIFAESVSTKMRDYDGHCIYAGGDDVLGFVPLYKAYACAKSLSQTFNQELQIAVNKLQQAQPNQKIKTPTLSVGLAIVHHMTPLGVIRELAKRAEKVAKGNDEAQDQQRNALGITLAVRSGATTDLRLRWTDDEGIEDQAHQALENWVKAYQNKELPSRIAYDTRAIHLQTQFALSDQYGHQIQQAEFNRMLDKARTAHGQAIPKQDLEKRVQQVKDLNQLANELIIARWLAAKTNQDLIKE